MGRGSAVGKDVPLEGRVRSSFWKAVRSEVGGRRFGEGIEVVGWEVEVASWEVEVMG